MARRRSSLVQRLLRRMLASGRGEVRALEAAIHLEGVLRFTVLFAATIILPTSLLGYFAVRSISVEEQGITQDVVSEARASADAFWSLTDRRFSSFEKGVSDRLAAGRSPLEGRGELHPQLLIALRFDDQGRLQAPFRPPDPGQRHSEADLFSDELAAAVAAENADLDPVRVAALYQQAARQAGDPALEGRALFDRARNLARAGNMREADLVLARVLERYPATRDAWGFRLGDLARLESAELSLAHSPAEGAEALRLLIDDLLATRWTIGEGGEAAVARRALSLLESDDTREWAAVARGRLAERTAMLYWAGRYADQLDDVVRDVGQLRVDEGQIRWKGGDGVLWATTWWDNAFYVFGLDQAAVIEELKIEARGSAAPDSEIVSVLLAADDPVPGEPLVQKTLAPWMPGWSLVITARDADSLAHAQAKRRTQRMSIIGAAGVMIAFGAVMLARVVKRELDMARMKTDFAANVSHELRSPITQIRIKGEALLLGLADTEAEQLLAYQAIVRESERLSRLVDNVLDFSAIERGAKQYTLRPGDIVDTVLRAVDSISSAQEVRDKELDVEFPDVLPVVHHDSDAVAQCVINLVSNAAKYSAPEGWIGIRGRVVEGGVEIAVSDRGIGIAPHDLREIFEPFFRSRDSLARRRKGTGIGLTITSYIMRSHGGNVSVQSRPGHGSTFTLRFPLTPPPPNKHFRVG